MEEVLPRETWTVQEDNGQLTTTTWKKKRWSMTMPEQADEEDKNTKADGGRVEAPPPLLWRQGRRRDNQVIALPLCVHAAGSRVKKSKSGSTF